MKNPKVGERVAVYGGTHRTTGEVMGFYLGKAEWVTVLLDGHEAPSVFSAEQCRRLKPKARRRVWIAVDHYDKGGGKDTDKPLYAYYEKPPTANDWVLFVEARKGKVRA